MWKGLRRLLMKVFLRFLSVPRPPLATLLPTATHKRVNDRLYVVRTFGLHSIFIFSFTVSARRRAVCYVLELQNIIVEIKILKARLATLLMCTWWCDHGIMRRMYHALPWVILPSEKVWNNLRWSEHWRCTICKQRGCKFVSTGPVKYFWVECIV